MIWGFWIFAKLHSRPEICAFENGLPKSGTFASLFVLFWRVPSLNGHSSARRGAIDPGPFSTARGFPADDLRHWKCLKSPFQAWLIRVQSSDTIWYFWAIFGRTSSFYWFSLFSLPLSRFWPISFEPPLENPRLRPVGLGPSGFCRPTDLRLGFSRGVIILFGSKIEKQGSLTLTCLKSQVYCTEPLKCLFPIKIQSEKAFYQTKSDAFLPKSKLTFYNSLNVHANKGLVKTQSRTF